MILGCRLHLEAILILNWRYVETITVSDLNMDGGKTRERTSHETLFTG